MWEAAYLIFALGAGARFWLRRRKQHQQPEWKAAAESLGLRLQQTAGSWSGKWRLPDGRSLGVRIAPSARRGQGPQIFIAGPWPWGFHLLQIRAERDRPAEAREVEIGDGPFDQAFSLEGPALLLFALLDEKTRRLLMTFPADTLKIGGAELRAEVGRLDTTGALRLLFDLAERFAEPLDLEQRVARNAREDSISEVRLRNLLLLVRELPGEAVTTEALRAAGADPSPKVRLRVAKALGAETRGLFLELAESTEDDTASAQAVALLGRELPAERTREILGQALRHRLFETVCACLEVLGGSSEPEDIDLLAQILAREKSGRLSTVVQALEATGNPAAEPPLLAALRHIRTDVRVAAAQALQRIGTAAAVLPLQETAEQTRDQDLRRAALQAVAEIQARLPGASPGQLSLSGAEAGQLSMAEIETGQLSLSSTEDSPPPERG